LQAFRSLWRRRIRAPRGQVLAAARVWFACGDRRRPYGRGGREAASRQRHGGGGHRPACRGYFSRLGAVLEVSAAGYHAWRRRPPSRRALRDRELERMIKAAFRDSRETYGAPRIQAELRRARHARGQEASRTPDAPATPGRPRRARVQLTLERRQYRKDHRLLERERRPSERQDAERKRVTRPAGLHLRRLAPS